MELQKGRKTHFYAGAMARSGGCGFSLGVCLFIFTKRNLSLTITRVYSTVWAGMEGLADSEKVAMAVSVFTATAHLLLLQNFPPFFPKARWNEQFDIKTKRRLKRAFSRYEKKLGNIAQPFTFGARFTSSAGKKVKKKTGRECLFFY